MGSLDRGENFYWNREGEGEIKCLVSSQLGWGIQMIYPYTVETFASIVLFHEKIIAS